MTLTFDLLTSKSNQFIFVRNFTEFGEIPISLVYDHRHTRMPSNDDGCIKKWHTVTF